MPTFKGSGFEGFEDDPPPPPHKLYWVRTVSETIQYVEVYSDWDPDTHRRDVVTDGSLDCRIPMGNPEVSVVQGIRPLTDMEKYLFLKAEVED